MVSRLNELLFTFCAGCSDSEFTYVTATSVTFDGDYFYVTSPATCQIARATISGELDMVYRTTMRFSLIYYDKSTDSFIGYVKDTPKLLYILDSEFQVTSTVTMDLPQECPCVLSISVDCCLDKYIIALTNAVYELNADGSFSRRLVRATDGKILFVLAICPYYLIHYRRTNGQELLVLSDEDGNIISRCNIARQIKVGSLIFSGDTSNIVYAVVSKGGNVAIGELVVEATPDNCNYFDIEPDPTTDCDIVQAATRIINSVADMEEALAKLILEESEKISYAIDSEASAEELVKINNSVSRTISNIAKLEGELKGKLNSAKAIIENADCNE